MAKTEHDSVNELKDEVHDTLSEILERMPVELAAFLLYDPLTQEFYLPVHAERESKTSTTQFFLNAELIERCNRAVKEKQAISQPFTEFDGIAHLSLFPWLLDGQTMGIFIMGHSASSIDMQDLGLLLDRMEQRAAHLARDLSLYRLRDYFFLSKLPENTYPYQEVAEIFSAVLNSPTAIWGFDSHRGTLGIIAHHDLPPAFMDNASVSIGDGSLISLVLETGKEQIIPYEDRNSYSDLKFLGESGQDLWSTVIAIPILVHHHIVLVLEVLEYHSSPQQRELLYKLSSMASKNLTNIAQAVESKRISEVAKELSEAPHMESAMRIMVKAAQRLTRGYAAILFFQDDSGHFNMGYRWPLADQPTAGEPRQTGGLSEGIVKKSKPLLIKDTWKDPRVRPKVQDEGIRSLIGIRVKAGKGKVGVLYVNGLRRHQFTKHDLLILKSLAAQLTTAMNWTQRLLEPAAEVEDLITKLYSLDNELEYIANELQTAEGYHYVTIQLIREDEQTIETVCGTDKAKAWTGIAKHLIEEDHEPFNIKHDIQVDVIKTQHIEVIGGFDDRFDKWIYESFNHANLVRAWIPMLYAIDVQGKLVEDWMGHCHWQLQSEKKDDRDWNQSYALDNSSIAQNGWSLHVIGVIEVAYALPDKLIDYNEVLRLASRVKKASIQVYKHTLPYLFARISEVACDLVGANASSFHYFPHSVDSDVGKMTYKGEIGHLFQEKKQSWYRLGEQAIREKTALFFPNKMQKQNLDDLISNHPKLYKAGIHFFAAFPLSMGENGNAVLFLYFKERHGFTEAETARVELFTRHGTQAIRDAMHILKAREHARRLGNLHAVVQALATTPKSTADLLRKVAGYGRNLLAADVVIIYEYDPKNQNLSKRPITAGRLRLGEHRLEEQALDLGEFIKSGQDVFILDFNEDLNTCHEIQGKPINRLYFKEEGILSMAGLILKAADEIVGVMLICFRRPPLMDSAAWQLFEILKSSTAALVKIANDQQRIRYDLKRRRDELNALYAMDRSIFEYSDIKQVLHIILQKASEIMQAQAAYVLTKTWKHERDVFKITASQGLNNKIVELDYEYGQYQNIEEELLLTHKPILIEVGKKGGCPRCESLLPDTLSMLIAPLWEDDKLKGILCAEHALQKGFFEEDIRLFERVGVQVLIAMHSLDLYADIERQLNSWHSLVIIASWSQKLVDLDSILRTLLTGITADQGLSFSRAMLFLFDDKLAHNLWGQVAIGACNQEEANNTWNSILEEKDLKDFLIETERFSQEVAQGGRQDYPLSLAVRNICISQYEDSAIGRCLESGSVEVVRYKEIDPFRDQLKKISGTEENMAFACVPLIGAYNQRLGVIVADNRFLLGERDIRGEKINSLMVYSNVISISIESFKLRISIEEKQMETLRLVTARIAHVIGTRITLIDSEVDRLREIVETNMQREHIRQIYQEISSAQRALMELRTFSTPFNSPKEPCNLAELLCSVANVYTKQEQLKVNLNLEIGHQIMGNRSKLSDAFIELINNAIQAMQKDNIEVKHIDIKTQLEKHDFGAVPYVRIEIENPSSGVPNEIKQRIFEPYFTTKRGGSSGLGLTIVNECILDHGGTITEVGIPGENARFVIRLPLIQA